MLNIKGKIVFSIIILLLIGGVGFLWNSSLGETNKEITTQTPAIILEKKIHKTFVHSYHNFSVEYPKELSIEQFNEEDDAETIVFRETTQQASDGEKIGFQIFIVPFGDDEVLTKNRILEDVPGAIIEESIEILLGDGTPALLFWSESLEIGKTREVWFTHGGYLYEITTYAYLDEWLAEILSTWSFNEL